jgi:hypothetical protein
MLFVHSGILRGHHAKRTKSTTQANWVFCSSVWAHGSNLDNSRFNVGGVWLMSISYSRTYQGAWELSTVVNGYFETQQYFYYTKKEATQLKGDEKNGY